MKKLRTAVIGLGVISGGHLQSYIDNEKTELTAICDKDTTWLSYMDNKLNIKYAYSDYRELLKNPEIDLVSVCLPTYLHAQVSIDALNAGKHVLCEKPMALNAAEGIAMRDAEKTNGKKLMISHNQRFGEDIQILKELNINKAFGDIYHVRIAWRRPLGMMPSPYTERENGAVYNRNWFNEKKCGGGVLRDLGSHLIDLTMYILDFPDFKQAFASSYRKFYPNVDKISDYVFDSEDMVTGLVKFDNGISVQLEVSFGSPVDTQELITNIYGTKMGAQRIGSEVKLIELSDKDSFTSRIADVSRFNVNKYRHPSYAIVDSILEDLPVPIPSDQGIKVLQVLDALYKSCENR